jgi:sulfopropanediol 3-dehydrogenase
MPVTMKRSTAKRPDDSGPEQIRATVRAILDAVRRDGDQAVSKYSQSLSDGRPRASASCPSGQRRLWSACPAQVIEDIQFVQSQVRRFAQHQRDSLSDFEVETLWVRENMATP